MGLFRHENNGAAARTGEQLMIWFLLPLFLLATTAAADPTIPAVGNLFDANGNIIQHWNDDHQNTLVDGGTTYYFANGGNDGNSCTSISAPCASLTRMKAVRHSGSNQLFKRGSSFPGTLEFHNGPSGTATNWTVYGAYGDPNAARPVFNGGKQSQNASNKSYMWFDRLNWRNHGVPRIRGGSHHFTFSYWHQQDTWQTGINMSAVGGPEPHHLTIANSNFDRIGLENNPCIIPPPGENFDGHEAIYISSSSGEDEEGGDDVHVYNTRIGSTTKEAFNSKDDADRNTYETILIEGQDYPQCDDPYVINAGDFSELGTTVFRNIFVRNRRFHSHIGSSAAVIHVGQNHTVENVIASNMPFSCVRMTGTNSNTIVRNILCHNVNSFFRSGTSTSDQNKVFNSIGTTGNGNIAYNSNLFINAAANDFRHASASSGGVNLYSNCRGSTKDIQGNVRPQGGNCDAGPFERSGTPPPPPPPPSGPDLYVRLNGNDTTGTGSTSLPFRTLQKCVDVVAAGDPNGRSCSLGAGTYAENVVIAGIKAASFTSPFTIKAEPGATAVLRATSGLTGVLFTDDSQFIVMQDGAGQLVVDGGGGITGNAVLMEGYLGATGSSADHIRLEGLEIKNAPSWCIYGAAGTVFNEYLGNDLHGCTAGMAIAGRFNVVQRNFIHDMPTGLGIKLYLDGSTAANNTAIRQNSIFNTGEAIGVEHGTEILIVNNQIFLNNKGIQLYDSDVSNVYIYYNSIAGNAVAGIDINSSVGASYLWANIAYGNGTNIVDDSGTSTLADNLTTDPLFVDVAMGNLTVQDTSDAIDAITCIPGITEDFAGVPRPQGDDCDIGAHETTAPPEPPGPVTGGRTQGGKFIGGTTR